MKPRVFRFFQILRNLKYFDPLALDSFNAIFIASKKQLENKKIALLTENPTHLENFLNTLELFDLTWVLLQKETPFFAQDVVVIDKSLLPFWEEVQSEFLFSYFTPGNVISQTLVVDNLVNLKFKRVDFVENEGEFAVRGSVIDIYPYGFANPIRIQLDMDRIVSIKIFDPVTQRSIRNLNGVILPCPGENIVEYAIIEERGNSLDLNIITNPSFMGKWDSLKGAIKRFKEKGYEVLFFTPDIKNFEYFEELLEVEVYKGGFYQGFSLEELKLAFFSDYEIKTKKAKKEKVIVIGERIESLEGLNIGDYVVYRDYGIGRFEGIETQRKDDIVFDTLVIRYEDGVVRVPVMNLNKVFKFVSTSQIPPKLSKLSSNYWQYWLKKLEEEAWKVAELILNTYAYQFLRRGIEFQKDDELMKEIEMSFPYELTEDQKRTIEEVKRDMESPFIMNRLIIGDVGFGKTEVALRASVKAVISGRQVAILVPTTILALQHYENFKKRLENIPIRVEMVSRLVPKSHTERILRDLEQGKVDIVIGTQRLLQDDVKFKSIGLLIIDEEHRFGVQEKEKLREKYPFIDTLRMTATPIPRTLYAALGKIHSLSIIQTPPQGRQEIETYVGPYSDEVVRNAIKFEFQRGGQVFYLHNRIENLIGIKEKIQNMFPDVKVGIVHGKLSEDEIENEFIKFYLQETKILISTSIIESGIDFPNCNTIIVEDAHLFGLAELYQIRGRVGRSHVKAYAYFFVPKKMPRKAYERLKTLKIHTKLGSGFKIAMADLEIRGAGNLLGYEQHGHAKKVGYDFFFYLLDEKIRKITHDKLQYEDIEITSSIPTYIPETYIENPHTRIHFYRRLAQAMNHREIEEVKEELLDRFGDLPIPLLNLLVLHHLRIYGIYKGYKKVELHPGVAYLYKDYSSLPQIKRVDILIPEFID